MIDYNPNLPSGSGSNFFNFAFLQHLSVGPGLLWGALLVIAAIIGLSTLVLYYHWLRYGFGDRNVLFAQVLYSVVVVASFIVMISSLTSYGAA